MNSSAHQPLRSVAVAGATGNCGRAVVRAAHAHGLRVRALVRRPEALADLADAVDEVRTVQVTERESLRGALDGVDLLVSAVGKTRQTDRIARQTVDVDANRFLFEEARAAGVARIGFVSVLGADPDSPIEMLRMKGEAEAALRATGVPAVVVRPSGFFSDLDAFLDTAARGRALWTVGDPDTRIDPISLPDLGRVVLEAALDPANVGRALPVGGPQRLSWRDVADACAQALGRPVRLHAVPLPLARLAVPLIRPFQRDAWEVAQFIVGMAERAPDLRPVPRGQQTLAEHFAARVAADAGASLSAA